MHDVHSVRGNTHHAVWIPKYRRKALHKDLKKYLKDIFHDLAHQRELRTYRRTFASRSRAYADRNFPQERAIEMAGYISLDGHGFRPL